MHGIGEKFHGKNSIIGCLGVKISAKQFFKLKKAGPLTKEPVGAGNNGVGISYQRTFFGFSATAVVRLEPNSREKRFSMLHRFPGIAVATLLMLLAGLTSEQTSIAADGEKSESATMKVIQRLPHKNYVQGLAWNSDGSKLATLSDFGATVTIWNARTWEKEREIRQYSAAYSGPGIGWTHDGKLLTSAGAKTQPEGIYSMNLWDPDTGALIQRIEGPPIPPGAVKHNQANRIAVKDRFARCNHPRSHPQYSADL
jgi:WD40 repeat protein